MAQGERAGGRVPVTGGAAPTARPAVRRRASALAGALLAATAVAATGAPADAQVFYPNTEAGSGIMATGQGEATMEVAGAVVYASFGGSAQDGEPAIPAALAARDAAVEALVALGLDAGDVTVFGVGYGRGGEMPMRRPGPGEPTTRWGRIGLRVEVAPIDRLDAVLAALESAGMEGILGFQPVPADPAPARREAIRHAVADARRQAEATAADMGVRLGALQFLGSSLMPVPGITDTYEMMRYQGPGAPLVPGRVTVTALVQARWDFEDGSD